MEIIVNINADEMANIIIRFRNIKISFRSWSFNIIFQTKYVKRNIGTPPKKRIINVNDKNSICLDITPLFSSADFCVGWNSLDVRSL
jgi:hypothetical protein